MFFLEIKKFSLFALFLMMLWILDPTGRLPITYPKTTNWPNLKIKKEPKLKPSLNFFSKTPKPESSCPHSKENKNRNWPPAASWIFFKLEGKVLPKNLRTTPHPGHYHKLSIKSPCLWALVWPCNPYFIPNLSVAIIKGRKNVYHLMKLGISSQDLQQLRLVLGPKPTPYKPG